MHILKPSDIPPLADLSKAMLKEMHTAGLRVQACERALLEAGSNVVADVLGAAREFYEWDHYPEGDVFCHDSHAQYYYHAHPPTERGNDWGNEHGHFHTFLRPRGFPDNVRKSAASDDTPAHLVAVSMDFDGRAVRLFTTNRWVTGEAWYDAETVSRFLHRFHIAHATPSQLANTWLAQLLVLFRPTIQALLHARDDILAAHRPVDADMHVHEDRTLEVASIIDIDVGGQLRAVEAALAD